MPLHLGSHRIPHIGSPAIQDGGALLSGSPGCPLLGQHEILCESCATSPDLRPQCLGEPGRRGRGDHPVAPHTFGTTGPNWGVSKHIKEEPGLILLCGTFFHRLKRTSSSLQKKSPQTCDLAHHEMQNLPRLSTEKVLLTNETTCLQKNLSTKESYRFTILFSFFNYSILKIKAAMFVFHIQGKYFCVSHKKTLPQNTIFLHQQIYAVRGGGSAARFSLSHSKGFWNPLPRSDGGFI